jgi:molybdenum cofactor cytidylyltransferase
VFVTGLVLAAGASRRLGEPKQLLAYRGTTVLGTTLDRARSCGFEQLLVTVGGASAELSDRVDFRGCQVVENEQYASGCSSSIGAALGVVDDRAEGIVLLLGDQPEVTTGAVMRLREAAGPSLLGVCRYDDGVGHPFWLRRQVFDDLRALHGDKAVWKLLESGRYPVHEVRVAGNVPLDVDTWEDYQALLAAANAGTGG